MKRNVLLFMFHLLAFRGTLVNKDKTKKAKIFHDIPIDIPCRRDDTSVCTLFHNGTIPSISLVAVAKLSYIFIIHADIVLSTTTEREATK